MDTKLSKDVSKVVMRQYEDTNRKMLKEKIRVVNRVYTLREQTQERRTWKKFGEVADLERGTNKPGDRLIGGGIQIVSNDGAQQEEIDIVKKLASLNTEQIKIRKQEEKLRNMELQNNQEDDFSVVPEKKPLRENKGASKLLEMEAFQKAHTDYSVLVRNLAVLQLAASKEQQDELIQQFRDFLEKKIGKSDSICRYTSRFVSLRGNYDGDVAPLRDIAYISFRVEDKALDAVDILDGANFLNCILQAELSQRR